MDSSAHTIVGYLHSLVGRRGDAAGDDRELLRRLVERRDGDALAVLMHRHGPMVLSLARRLSGDEHSAEDVFQATFLLLARKARTIRRAESLACWLHGVAHRFALQVRRAQQRRRLREARAQVPSPPTPFDELTAQELLAVLDEELQKLPQRQRAALIACCLEGLAQEEAARRLGCSADAVRGRLERGRQRLRLRLEKRGLTLPAVLGGTLLIAGATSPVPVALAQSTLQAATTEGGAAPSVAALIEEAMRSVLLHKLKVMGAAVMLLVLSGTGVGMMVLRPQTVPENTLSVADLGDKQLSAKKHVDLYGDPLPEGAVMRMGTIQRCAAGVHLAVTADGKSIVGARNCLDLNIWDSATGELRRKRELPEPGGESTLSPDGRWLAQSGWEQPFAIWDVRTVEKVRVLGTEEKRSYWPIVFSRDGSRVAAIGRREEKEGGCDNLICAWSLADGKEIFRTGVRNNRRGHRLVFSPDSKRLLATFSSSMSDSGLYCWDIAAGRQEWIKNAISPESMVFTSDGKILTSPYGRIVDLATGRTVKMESLPPIPLKDKGGVVYYTDTQLAMTANGRTLLIPKPEGVIVWDMIRGKQLQLLEGAGEEIVVMPDGKSVLANDGSLQRWDLETGKPMWPDTFALGHIGKVDKGAFSANGKRVASVSLDGSVRLWDAATGQPLRVWRAFRPRRHSFNEKCLDISPDGRWILSGGWNEPIKLWDASSDKEVRSIALPPYDKSRERDFSAYHLRVSADGSRAVALFGVMTDPPIFDHRLATWDLKTGQMLTCYSFKQSNPRSSTLSPDGGLLLRDGDLVDTASGRQIARLEGLPSYPCAFSNDGALVLGGPQRVVQKGGDIQPTGSLRVWESATGRTVAQLKSNMWTREVAFHPSNRLLASKGDRVQLHDAVTGRL